MSKPSEWIALLEWAERKNKVPVSSSKKEPSLKDWVKFQKELKEFEEFQKFLESKNKEKDDKKKEEKKDDKGMSVVQKTIILTFLSPFLGLGYLYIFSMLLKSVSKMFM